MLVHPAPRPRTRNRVRILRARTRATADPWQQRQDQVVLPADRVDDVLGPMDLIVEATGVAKLEFNLLDALAVDGVYMLTGIPGGERPINIPGADLIRQLVLGNQAMVGSVNAARDHFQMAVADLAVADKRWPGHTAHLITGRYSTANFADAFAKPAPDEIKAVVEWVA